MKRISTELLLLTLNLYARNVLTISALTNGEPDCCILGILTKASTEAMISCSDHPEPATTLGSSNVVNR